MSSNLIIYFSDSILAYTKDGRDDFSKRSR